MSTNEERREVARKMRLNAWMAHHMNTSDDFAREVFRAAMDEAIGDYRAAIDRLADLIEPEHERTCRRRNHDTDNYYMRCCSCSRCNAGWFEDIYDKPFSYCPHCGAKVVGNVPEEP